MPVNVLLASRDLSLIDAFQKVVGLVKGCQLVSFSSIDDVLPCLRRPESGVVVLHLNQAAGIGNDDLSAVLGSIHADRLSLAVLVVSDVHQSDQVLSILRMGVADCLCRPLELRRAAFLIDSLTVRARLARNEMRTAQLPPVSVQRLGGEEGYLYCSGPMTTVVDHIRKLAGHDSSILLTGETGTGKSRTARLVHELSPRADEPFVAINCAALPETLIESELFGHRRGAFTGADTDYSGRFMQAGKGTLFLDEIDALPLVSQGKLLRAVDERLFEPLGSGQQLALQARLIVATNHSLEAEVAASRFRLDLYYRLNVVEISIPPLRQRREEIRYIVEQQIREAAARNNRHPARLAPGVLELLEAYDWPGNIRELRNVIERALTFCEQDEILAIDLPRRLQQAFTGPGDASDCDVVTHRYEPSHRGTAGSSPPLDAPDSVDDSSTGMFASASLLSPLARARSRGEIERIRQALQRHNNSRTEAARELGISRAALYKKLHQYDLLPPNRPR